MSRYRYLALPIAALLSTAVISPVALAAPDSQQPVIADSPGPAACVPYSGDITKGNGQFPLGLQAPDFGNEGYEALEVAERQDLPQRIDFRDNAQGFNRKIEAALRDGHIYVRNIGDATWRVMPTPECIDGQIIGISINEDALVALDQAGWIYTASNLLSSPNRWGWIRAWGGPFWFGPGLQSPSTTPYQWSLSIIGNRTDRVYDTPDGKQQPISLAKVTQVLALDGSRIYSLDPWLARDYSYEVGSPINGRFIPGSISASGSQIFVINRYGDMFTRLDDFDVKGADPAQFRYTWGEDPRPAAPDALTHRLDPRTAPIGLPGDDWHPQPKIPGEITQRISIHSTGEGSDQRELRVEGRDQGRTGYWHKQLFDANWSFTPTDAPLEAALLENSPSDRSSDTLAPPSPYSYSGELSPGVQLDIDAFSYASPKREVQLRIGQRVYPLILHTVDGRLGTALSMRMLPGEGEFGARPAGLVEAVPRNYAAAFEVPDTTKAAAAHDLELQAFLANYLAGEQFHQVYLKVVPSQMEVINSPIADIALSTPGGVARLASKS
ncbi:hypothetical protein [Corynebacterium pseudopelargi]|uniref:Secreted protein n=1 Tax=Corynebacterium pseudopelargi TaxID=2080757 RepID=A0A3G6IVW4_9CORY|nr:hypothetical protein [Corynebacterium pseudopelargi]AZA09713.1 hypothetical protein CPPEL_08030 [Corynebacterium pseudopelargi]